MNKKVYVSIFGTSVADGNSDTAELVTEGDYAIRNGKYLLRYKEQLDEGFGESSTIIKIDRNNVVMTRTGYSNTQMIFEKGKRHMSHYETPLGSFTIGVSCDNLTVGVDENGGDVEIDYSLDINNSPPIFNKLRLNIRGEGIQG